MQDLPLLLRHKLRQTLLKLSRMLPPLPLSQPQQPPLLP
jgi:hypothetical protein